MMIWRSYEASFQTKLTRNRALIIGPTNGTTLLKLSSTGLISAVLSVPFLSPQWHRMPVEPRGLFIALIGFNIDHHDLPMELPTARMTIQVAGQDVAAAANVSPQNRQASVRPQ